MKSFIRSMTLRILLEIYLKIYGGDIGMYLTIFPLVYNYKNNNYRIYTLKIRIFKLFLKLKYF